LSFHDIAGFFFLANAVPMSQSCLFLFFFLRTPSLPISMGRTTSVYPFIFLFPLFRAFAVLKEMSPLLFFFLCYPFRANQSTNSPLLSPSLKILYFFLTGLGLGRDAASCPSGANYLVFFSAFPVFFFAPAAPTLSPARPARNRPSWFRSDGFLHAVLGCVPVPQFFPLPFFLVPPPKPPLP